VKAFADLDRPTSQLVEPAPVVRTVTVIMGFVVGLTFLFGFGNVLNLALRLGVPVWVAPLVAPAVDLSILGLLLGIRHLALAGATLTELQPVRRLLIFASLVTLALNVAEPIVAGEYGKAAFDAVGPLLLIGWGEVGPGLLQAMAGSYAEPEVSHADGIASMRGADMGDADQPRRVTAGVAEGALGERLISREPDRAAGDDLLARARQEDARHWERHRRPISAETLRKRLGVGAARSRMLVSVIRSNQAGRGSLHSVQTP
jgi:hypothetical protein